ncbi:MAG: TonB-dependent receptor [Thalassolituus sp.]|nr:MAG: TonB-dependent receptor [Thalassolituus sp.]
MNHKKQFLSLVLPTISAVAAMPVLAEDQPIELEKFVVTAAGYEQKIVDAPASISVITQEDLRSRPYVTLLDAVRELEGVDIGETRDKTGQGTISIRGMGSDYTLILIDGRRQNNHGDIYPNNFGGNQFNHIPPIDAIERIEVIRGPASTLYGADALGGVINIITKKVNDDWTGAVSVSRTFQEYAEYGADTTADFNVSGPLIDDVLGLELRGSIYKRDASEPEYDSVTDPNGVEQTRELGFGRGGKTTDNTNQSVGFGLNWKVTEDQNLTFDFDTSKQVYDNEPSEDGSFPLGTVDSIDTIWRDRGGVVEPRVGYAQDQEFTRDQWSIAHEGSWSFGKSLVSLQSIETNNNGRTLPLSVSERQLLQEMYDGTGDYAGLSEDERRAIAEETFLPRPGRTMESSQYTLDAKLEIPVADLAGDHLFIVGGQYIDAELTDGVFGREDGESGAVSDFTTYALFAEDSWTMVPDFTLTAGLRYDNHDAFGSNVSPRLYAVYTLTPEWTMKGGVSSGYKTPKTTDLYDGVIGFGRQGTMPFAGNPDLEPEKSRNTEVAVYWESMEDRHSFNATIFHNRFEDKIARGDAVQTCAQTGGERPCVNLGEYEDLGYDSWAQVINIDDALIRGAEVAGRYQIIDALALRGNYTYTDSRQLSGSQEGQPLTNTAEHMTNVTLDWDVNTKVNVQLTSETRSARFRGVDDDNDPLYYKDYRVLHLGATYAVNGNVSVYGRINNLLDQDFTTYSVDFNDTDDDGEFDEVEYQDDYNNKDKRRNLWVGLNVRF